MYDFKKTEKEILEFWKKNQIYKKVKEKNKGKKPFYYLDGPPYTSGRIHLGHAWGKSMRDTVMRYKRMQGLDVWDRSGFDMHGLPTEHATEKELGIHGKEGIEKLGVDKFVRACEKISIRNMKKMIEEFIELGIWMDFENPYLPINNSYIEGVWWLIKKAHENGRLYEGKRTMHWCSSCATANAKHELEYANLTDKSIYLKFPIIGEDKTFLIIWTTTPWTIPFNLAVMVNPEVTYVKAKVRDEIWIIAKDLVDDVIIEKAETGYTIEEEIQGKDLEGIKYKHPFNLDIYTELEQEAKKLHTVVLSKEYVNTESGTGLVHCAPGCGQEDYEVGHKNNLPAFNELDEFGVFKECMGQFKGLVAKTDDINFIRILDETGLLITSTPITHDYPICWRCKNPVIFRTTEQWFFKVEDLKENMKELNKKVTWVPEWAGSQQFHNWLDNLRDNSITKQRYWGTPLPIWKCDDGDYIVIGSLKELKKLANKVPENLHKPWIDKIIIEKNGKTYKKIPDVIDVWVDAGCCSWLCLDYPQKTELFEKLFPADFILEGKDQIRGWFNILLIASMVSMNKHPYKAVYMHGFVNDSQGRKMSKSLENYILPEEVTMNYGKDAFRYYFIGGSNAGVDINYNLNDLKLKSRNLTVLWNLKNLLFNLSRNNNFNTNTKPNQFGIEEKYMLSKANSLIKKLTQTYEEYKVNETPWVAEELYFELSRTYIQQVRNKTNGTDDEKKQVFYTLYNILFNTLKCLAPTIPFITEAIYQELKEEFNLKEESIHLFSWPEVNEKLIDKQLEQDMSNAKAVIQSILSERDKEKLGVRWPLPSAEIYLHNQDCLNSIKRVESIIKNQTKIVELKLKIVEENIADKIENNVKLNTNLTPELELEGFTNEVMRLVQNLRKQSKLKIENKIELAILSDIDLSKNKEKISEKVGAYTLVFEKTKEYDKILEKRLKGKNFTILFNILT